MNEIEVIARGLCIRDGKVLLCRHIKQAYNYLPGGHVEFGESATDALAREMMEEAGVEVDVGPCVFVSEGEFDTKKRHHHELNIVFLMELQPGTAIESIEPKIAFDWIDLASIVDTDIRPPAAKAWLAAGPPAHHLEWVSEIPTKE